METRWKMLLVVIMAIIPCLQLTAQVNYRHFLTVGRIELSEDRFADAIRSFNTAIQSKPDQFEAYFLRGIAKYSLGDYKGAADDFSETIRLHPLYARAYHYRGIANDRLSNYFDARQDFKRALEIDPYNADIYLAFGATRMQLQDYEGAIKDYDMALLINPRFSQAWLNRGIAKRMIGDKQAALSDMDKAVIHDHFSADAWLKRGILRSELLDFEGSLSDFNQALRIDNENPLVYFQRAMVHLQSGDTTAALNDLEHTNILDPRNALTYYNRALLHALKGETDVAVALYSEVISINPKNIYSYYNRGIGYYLLQQFDKAERDFSTVVELFPGFAGAWMNRSVVRKQMKNTKGANADYERAMAIIDAVNTSNESPEKLFAKYADSAYFNKIIQLESEFISGNMANSRPQFRQIDIEPFQQFVVALYDPKPRPQQAGIIPYTDEFSLAINQLLSHGPSVGVFIPAPSKNENNSPVSRLLADGTAEKLPENVLFFVKGLEHYQLGNYEQASVAFSILEQDKALADIALFNRATLLFEADNIMSTGHTQQGTITISDGKNAAPHFHAEQKTKPDYKASLLLLNKLIRRKPNHAFSYYNRANIMLQLGEFHRAIDDYSEAIRFEPSMKEAYYNRALTLLYLGENALACSDLSKAGELGIAEAYAVIRRFCRQ